MVVPAQRHETSEVGRRLIKALPALDAREGSSFRSAVRRYSRVHSKSL